MEGFKAFEKGLICRGKQYAENTVFEENQATICRNGMHFCKNPLDVFDYYPLIDKNGDFSEFAKVESLDVAHTDNEKKYCTKKLKIGAKISVTDYIKGAFKITYENIKNEVAEATKDAKDSGDRATLAGGYSATLAGGDYSTLAGGDYSTLAGGDYSKLAGGDRAVLAGGNSAKLAGGDYSTLAGGDYSKLAGGDSAKLAGGDYSKLAGGNSATLAGGYRAVLAGGYSATLAGGYSAIMIGDHGSRAKGGIGSVITLVERNEISEIIAFKAEQVDGERIKADTWYNLVDGEFEEV